MKVFDIHRWCKALYTFISLSPYRNELSEQIVELLIPKFSEEPKPTEVLGKKLALIFLLDYINENNDLLKIDEDVLSKIIFLVSQLIEDSVIGLIAAFVLSRCIKKVEKSNFEVIVLPIMKCMFSKILTVETCPQLYLILISLNNEQSETINSVSCVDCRENVGNFVKVFKTMNDNDISFYFHCLAKSEIFENFWNVFIDQFNKNTFIYREKEILLRCLLESVHMTDEHRKDVIDVIWKEGNVWRFFLVNLSNNGSSFQGFCHNIISHISTNEDPFNKKILNKLFRYFLTVADYTTHVMEANVQESWRLSLICLPHIENKEEFEKYLDILMGYYNLSEVKNLEKVFIIDQIIYMVQCCSDETIEVKTISNILAIQSRDLVKHENVSDSVIYAQFSCLISCVYHIFIKRNMSLNQYLLFLKSLLDLSVSNMANNDVKGKVIKIFKSLSKYIENQLSIDNGIEEINKKIFPCFGSISCYLCFFLLTKVDLTQNTKFKKTLSKVIKWIKNSFEEIQQSFNIISSDWKVRLLDVLVNIRDDNMSLMTLVMSNIVIILTRTRTFDISDVKYLKDIIFLDQGSRQISEFSDLFLNSDYKDIESEQNISKLEMNSRKLKERCVNIITTILPQSDSVDMSSICLLTMLDICNKDTFYIMEIEVAVKRYLKDSSLQCNRFPETEDVVTAINNILAQLNGIHDYKDSDNMVSDMIASLLNRINLSEITISSTRTLLDVVLFEHENNSKLQKALLQNIRIIWNLKLYLIECIERNDINQTSKYEVYKFIKLLLKSNEKFEEFDQFLTALLNVCVKTLSEFDFEKINSQLITVIIEIMSIIFKVNKTFMKLPIELEDRFQNVLKMKSEFKMVNSIRTFNRIYKTSNFILKLKSMEGLYENDSRLSCLLKLLPAECSRDSDFNQNVPKKSKKKAEMKGVSIPKLLNQANSKVTKKDVKATSSENEIILSSTKQSGAKDSKKRKSKSENDVKSKKSKVESIIINDSNIKTNDVQKKIKKKQNKRKEPTAVIKPVSPEQVKETSNDEIIDKEIRTDLFYEANSIVDENKTSESTIIVDKKDKKKKNKLHQLNSGDVEIKAINISSALIGKSKKKKKKSKREDKTPEDKKNNVKIIEIVNVENSSSKAKSTFENLEKGKKSDEKKKKRNKMRKERRENEMDVD